MQYMKGLIMVDPDAARTIFMVLFMVFEPLRLLAGYYGNLREEVRCNFFPHADMVIQRPQRGESQCRCPCCWFSYCSVSFRPCQLVSTCSWRSITWIHHSWLFSCRSWLSCLRALDLEAMLCALAHAHCGRTECQQ